jgi:hypothetical protein
MEREIFLSGYCRCLDHSRMVEAVVEGSELLEVDCSFGSCIYEGNCPIAEKLRELTQTA